MEVLFDHFISESEAGAMTQDFSAELAFFTREKLDERIEH